jgi:heme exporter protein C
MTQLATLQKPGIVQRYLPWLGAVTGIAVLVFAAAVAFYAPEDELTGLVQKIFYVHVSSAWIAAVAFFVVFLGSIGYLWKRDMRFDAIAAASAEVGLMFTTVVLVTGMLWGKEVWGVYWSWDPRLTSVLVLWLLYLAYVAIRAYTPEPTRRARFSAVIGIVAFLDVPIVYLSIMWWRTIHPQPVIIGAAEKDALPPEMLVTLMVGLATTSLVFVYFVCMRLNLNRLENELKRGVSQ